MKSFRNISRGIIIAALIMFVAATFNCCVNLFSYVDVYPSHFKIHTPFILNGGIMINTYWGNKKKHHVLYLDNHSPSWIRNSLIQFDEPFTKSKNVAFKTSTADGSPVQGDVGICDSLFFEGITFNKVPFYVIRDSSKNNTTVDGALGIDAMSKAIWKIDFTKSELTCSSDMDSFKEVGQMEILAATFTRESIALDVDFGRHNVKALAIDLGYNGDMILPSGDFKKACPSSKTFARVGKFMTPAGENIVDNISTIDTVKINHNWFVAEISTNKTVSERLIGLAFFRRFDYVIFDFVNERIYVPKKIW
jgi:hypothetical protein